MACRRSRPDGLGRVHQQMKKPAWIAMKVDPGRLHRNVSVAIVAGAFRPSRNFLSGGTEKN